MRLLKFKYILTLTALSGIILIFALAACGYSTVTPIPTAIPTPIVPTASPTPLDTVAATATAISIATNNQLKLIAEAEQKWKSQNIQSYRLKQKWFYTQFQRTRLEVIVRDGEITGQSVTCIPEGAYSECFDPGFSSASGATVENIFVTAREQVFRDQEATMRGGKHRLTIQFDPTYGFPQKISYQLLDVTDLDSLWEVELFEVLK